MSHTMETHWQLLVVSSFTKQVTAWCTVPIIFIINIYRKEKSSKNGFQVAEYLRSAIATSYAARPFYFVFRSHQLQNIDANKIPEILYQENRMRVAPFLFLLYRERDERHFSTKCDKRVYTVKCHSSLIFFFLVGQHGK
ncbi:uncharacterized protein BYT42DRAFT_556428 [Radiomyces spectabilis]|uniref:uncharacterized protein n=1 Tax=Radiomyces spectabilis TaxID=64574 RepID=UPI00221E9540|nr:uncharacterized protein BYT42DRAFT_556428 [Radiomyces spectabilis]KAI8391304.1 hypothetical protein BYT42DRAFT_556428 [Radiomyces spectabilis]